MFSDRVEEPIKNAEYFSTKYNTTRCVQLILPGSNSAPFLEGKQRAISALQN